MASLWEAFEKFEQWMKSKTPLKVTAIAQGRPTEVFVAKVIGVDLDASQVLISNPLVMHSAACFDVEGAVFAVEPGKVVATRDSADWIVFEEASEMTPAWPLPVR